MKIPKLGRYAQSAWINLNERLLNISTDDRDQYYESRGWRGPKIDTLQNQDNLVYATPDYFHIYKIIRLLHPQPEDIVYDIGSGMGRILCVVSRRKVQKCVGIEILEEICVIAKANAEKVRRRRSPIEIRCEDAALADVSDGTIYLLFNPFGPETMRDLLGNIEKSLSENPRRLRVVYYNSECRDIIESCSWLRRYNSFRTFSGLDVDFFETIDRVVPAAVRDRLTPG